ncbi:hypothetical protein B0H13DRAFT_1862636 [Mycena leptocephala]|nr:hypothetical protein B0H13DRAFT_1862636 [Mycena leptocephala]
MLVGNWQAAAAAATNKFEIFGDFEGGAVRRDSEREGAVRLDANLMQGNFRRNLWRPGEFLRDSTRQGNGKVGIAQLSLLLLTTMSPAALDAGGHWWGAGMAGMEGMEGKLGQRAVRRDKSQSALTGRGRHNGRTREHRRSEEKTKIEGGVAGRKREAGWRDFDALTDTTDVAGGLGGTAGCLMVADNGRCGETSGMGCGRTDMRSRLERRRKYLEGRAMKGIQGRKRLVPKTPMQNVPLVIKYSLWCTIYIRGVCTALTATANAI